MIFSLKLTCAEIEQEYGDFVELEKKHTWIVYDKCTLKVYFIETLSVL